MKNVLVLICAMFVGVIMKPQMLSASDLVKVNGIANLGTTETVIETSAPETTTENTNEPPAPAPEVVAQPQAVVQTAVAPVVETAPVVAAAPAPEPEPVYVSPSPSITVAGRTLPLYESSSMADESGNNVLRYNKLLRGHNSDQVFGVLYGMNACNVSNNCTFSITENGATRSYRIAERVEYTVENYNTGRLSSASGATTMYELANNAKGHTYALFTCYGEYDYNINRYKQVLVLYADAV